MPDESKYISKLRGSRVLIIGGSGGIGFAVAEAAIEHGAEVIISSSKTENVKNAIASIRASYPSATNRISGFAYDLSDETTIEKNILELLEKSGKLDHIVYTAGNPVPPIPIEAATLDAIKLATTVRYTGPIFLAKHASKYLNPGPASSITLTTGLVSERPIPGWSTIAGPRSAVQGLSRALALDLRPLRVNAVCVGAVDTGTWAHLDAEKKEKAFAALVGKTTTGRIAQASDVAEAYLYLMKDSNVTGSIIHSNGGALLL